MRSVRASCFDSSPGFFKKETGFVSATSQGRSTWNLFVVLGNFWATLLANSSGMISSFQLEDFIDQALNIRGSLRRLGEQEDRSSLARCLSDLRILPDDGLGKIFGVMGLQGLLRQL